MSGVHPIPPRQASAFNLAMAERLGVSIELVTSEGFSVEVWGGNDDAVITWKGLALLPATEALAMLNKAGRA